MDWGWSLNDNASRCNCPLNENEKQWQAVGNVTKLWGSHTSKVGIDVRRAYNLRVPSDRHRSGELMFNALRTAAPAREDSVWPRFCWGTSRTGPTEAFGRYVSTSLEARERQWRHFYYAQDTWRMNPKLTLNYGLRLDVINPQTVNEARNGTWIDLTTGRGLVAGVGDIDLYGNTENRFNWAPRVGATYQVNEKTVIRSGYGRSYDIGVFGSLFGHTVTQNLPVLAAQSITAPDQFAAVFNLAQGPPDPTFIEPGADGTFTWPDGVTPLVLPRKQRPPTVDAWNVTVQRQLTTQRRRRSPTSGIMAVTCSLATTRMTISTPFLSRGSSHLAVRRHRAYPPTCGGRSSLVGTCRTSWALEATSAGLGEVQAYFNEAHNWYNALQARFTRRFSDGWSAQLNYTLQRATNYDDDYWIYDPDLNKGPADFDRTHNFTAAVLYELPFGKGKTYGADWNGLAEGLLGGWQLNTNMFILSGTRSTSTIATRVRTATRVRAV